MEKLIHPSIYAQQQHLLHIFTTRIYALKYFHRFERSHGKGICVIYFERYEVASVPCGRKIKTNIRWKRYLLKEIIDCLRRRYAYIYADQEFSHLHRLQELIKHFSFFSAMFYWGLVLMDIPYISNWYQERILKLLSYLRTSY